MIGGIKSILERQRSSPICKKKKVSLKDSNIGKKSLCARDKLKYQYRMPTVLKTLIIKA